MTAPPIAPYGRTAARAHGQPGQTLRPASMTIDMHAHVLVPEAAALAEPHVTATNPMGQFATPETRAVNARQGAERRANLTDLALRLSDMDAAGVDLQVVMPPPGQCYYAVPPDIGVRAARIVNDGMAAWVAQRPDRFAALGSVPLGAPDAVVAELERCMGALGLKGVQILTNVNGREISDPEFAPFWACAEALGAVVLIHPNGFTHAERLSRFYFNNVIGNPFETALALHYLIFDGVLLRHPALKVIAVHGGGYLAGYSGRIDHAWGARPDCHAGLPEPPSVYLKRVYVDTIVFTPHQLDALVGLFGVDRVLMGTDYPFDMAESDPIGHLASSRNIDSTTMAALAGGNARRLFGL